MDVIEYLKAGVILTTPIFFLVSLVLMWKVIRSLDTHLEFLIYVANQVRELSKPDESDSGKGKGKAS